MNPNAVLNANILALAVLMHLKELADKGLEDEAFGRDEQERSVLEARADRLAKLATHVWRLDS